MNPRFRAVGAALTLSLAKLKTLLQVNEITPENKKLFVAGTRPVYQQYEASIGKEFLDKAIKELG